MNHDLVLLLNTTVYPNGHPPQAFWSRMTASDLKHRKIMEATLLYIMQ